MKNDICQYIGDLMTARVETIFNAGGDAPEGHDDNAEWFHGLRKEVRALRALLVFIKPLDLEKRFYPIRIKLRDWFRNGDIRRDLDALAARWEMLQGQLPASGGGSFLNKYFRTRILSIKDVAPAGQLAAALTELRAVIDNGDWCKEKKPLKDFVKKRLGRWDKEIRNAGGSLKFMDKNGLHALRIKCKNLRYATESFLPLWSEKNTETMLKALKNLQDILGQIHDIDNTPNIIAEILHNEDPVAAFEVGFLTGRQSAEREDCMRRLDKEWKRYRKAVRPWNNKD
ncbi:MAG: CHAD domain-containing protein [bacterium]